MSAARREQPDVILLDVGLPGGDGLTVLERYTGFPDLSCIPVVVLTGRDPRVTEPAARRLGAAGFLSKPAENEALLAAIASAMHGGTDAPGEPGEDHPTAGDGRPAPMATLPAQAT